MIIKKMSKLFVLIWIFSFIITFNSFSTEHNFQEWLVNFKNQAVSEGVSKEVVEDIMSNAKFLPKVIEYDRYQPEFYEDTFTYIKKRTSKKKLKDGIKLYKKRKKLLTKLKMNFKSRKNYY